MSAVEKAILKMKLFEEFLIADTGYLISENLETKQQESYFDDVFSEAKTEIERFINERRKIVEDCTSLFNASGLNFD